MCLMGLTSLTQVGQIYRQQNHREKARNDENKVQPRVYLKCGGCEGLGVHLGQQRVSNGL